MGLKDKFVVLPDPSSAETLERMTRSGTHAARALARPHPPDGRRRRGRRRRAGRGDRRGRRRRPATVARIRKLFATSGLEVALRRRRPTGRQYRKLDGAREARLIAAGPLGAAGGPGRWTLRLLADRLVELEVVPAIDPSTVQRTLKKTSSSRG